jgi:hypothetical protein
VIDLSLSKISNKSYAVSGFWAEFLGFGTIVLQTLVGDLVIRQVAHCETVFAKLSDAIRDAEMTGGDVSPESNPPLTRKIVFRNNRAVNGDNDIMDTNDDNEYAEDIEIKENN